MAAIKNKTGGVWYCAFLAVLLIAIGFICCAGGGADSVPKAAQGGDTPNETLKMEDYPHELGTFEGLDVETEWQILLDYVEIFYKNWPTITGQFKMDQFKVDQFFGVYNGCYVVGIPNVFTRASWGYSVEGISFGFNRGWYHIIWKSNQIIDKHHGFQDAYDAGWLTKEDLQRIADKINNSNWGEK